jgi:hypothetical protein
LWTDGILDRLAGHEVLTDLVLLRLLAVVGVLLLAWGIASLARSTGHDPTGAVLLGVGSPLALSVLIGGAHNDALMAGLLVCGVAVALRSGPVPGIALCALAAGVKAPAALGLVFIGWTWAGRDATVVARVARTALAGALGAATLEVVSLATGIGWGWIHTALAPDQVFTGVTPVDAVAHAMASTAHLVSWSLSQSTARGVVAVAALVAAGLIGAWQLWGSAQSGPVRPLGISLLVLALLGPILWPWYLTWGTGLLAAVAVARLRVVLVVLTVVESLVGASPVRGVVLTLLHAGLLQALLAVLILAAVTVAPLAMPMRRRPRAPTVDVAADQAHAGGGVTLLTSWPCR